MKAKSRKRLLISSVAMLLVAMLALGTATFAWFTSSTTATANGISVSTVKASELQISKSDLAWGTSVNYQENEIMTPVSTANGTNWFEANAETKDAYAKKSTDAFSAVNTIANHYFVEQLNIRNNGEADISNVTITITGLNNDYVRVALVPVQANTTNATFTPVTGETFAGNVYDNAGVAYNAASAATATGTTEITPSNSTTVSVGTLTGKNGDNITGIAYYKLFVWFEGQDAQCYDGTAGATVSGLSFSVSGTTVVNTGS